MLEKLEKYFENQPWLYDLIIISAVLLLAVITYFVAKYIIIKSVRSIVKRTKTKYDDILLNENVLKKLAYIVPFIVINEFSYLIPEASTFVSNLTSAITALLIILTIGAFLTAVNDLYDTITEHKKRPIKGYIQVVKIIVYIIGGIFIIGLLTGQDLIELLAGVGALTAVLILIFKDTILSFVASIQINSYDLVRIGDWIEIPSYGVDGDIMDISLHTIKVRNFDKTITTIPTNKLIEVSFKNWRGMEETGGRRIKRAINIDLSSIKFCDNKMLEKFENFQLISDYIRSKKEELSKNNKEKIKDDSHLINGRRLTNVGTFRAYLKAYLRSREDIHKGLTFLIRQLSPGAHGLPIEIYVFTNITDWIKYEDIQADIFDHIFAVIPEFDLRIYQEPSGSDVQTLSKFQNQG
ncbi:mechanosensitive ion channel family protein [Bacteroidota bacterium]